MFEQLQYFEDKTDDSEAVLSIFLLRIKGDAKPET